MKINHGQQSAFDDAVDELIEAARDTARSEVRGGVEEKRDADRLAAAKRNVLYLCDVALDLGRESPKRVPRDEFDLLLYKFASAFSDHEAFVKVGRAIDWDSPDTQRLFRRLRISERAAHHALMEAAGYDPEGEEDDAG